MTCDTATMLEAMLADEAVRESAVAQYCLAMWRLGEVSIEQALILAVRHLCQQNQELLRIELDLLLHGAPPIIIPEFSHVRDYRGPGPDPAMPSATPEPPVPRRAPE